MLLRILATVLILLLSTLTSSLWASGNDSADLARKTPQGLIDKGKTLYAQYCAHCHGISGDGDGFNAEYLDKEPAELSHAKFQSKKTNHQIYRTIKKGGAGVRKSTLMPLFGKTLSETEIWALVAYIRFLGKDTSHPVFLPSGANSERPRAEPVSGKQLQIFTQWFEEKDKSDAAIAKGKKLFIKKKSCFACHQLEEEGGRVGPEFVRAGFLYPPQWVYAWMMSPQSYKPDTKMPNMDTTPEEAQAIAAFLSTLVTEEEPDEEATAFLQTPGDPEKGKKLFFDPEGTVYCSKCHRVNGEGGEVGPDLSHVGASRTPEFLLESILNPKAVITSGYATVLILTKDGEFITGIKKNEDDSGLAIIDKEGKELYIRKEEIKKYKTQKLSMMPGNFKDLLEAGEMADILAYLKTLTLPEFAGVASTQP